MEPSTSTRGFHDTTGCLHSLLTDRAAAGTLDARSSSCTADDRKPRSAWTLEDWQRRASQILASEVGARPNRGPAPPPEWAPTLRQLTQLARVPAPAPSWWTPATAFCGSMETRTAPAHDDLDGTIHPAATDPPVYVQLTLAGWGHFQIQGQAPHRVGPGKALFAVAPSRHRCYLPRQSPGWTFAWIGIYHPYLTTRIARQVASTGPVIDVVPDGAVSASLLRLLRGTIKKDFRDQYAVEIALFEFLVSFERWARQGPAGSSQDQRLVDEVRSRIVARLPKAMGVRSLAAEFGMGRSHFSYVFREQTGLTPAHFATEVRTKEAERLLLDTQQPLKSIAAACGFASANHFCKVFRRLRHLSPAKFRQAFRQGAHPTGSRPAGTAKLPIG